MALFARKTASFDAIKPVPDLVKLDDELNQIVGSVGVFNGNATGTRILTKYTHATEPVYELDQLGAGTILLLKQNGVEKLRVANNGQIVSALATGTKPLDVASTTVCTNLNADKVDGFDIPGDQTAWSVSWYIADPSTFATGDDTLLPVFIVPAGNTVASTKVKVTFYSGSHTSGGSLDFRPVFTNAAGAGVTELASILLDNTNNTIKVTYSATCTGSLTEGDKISLKLAARSGTITERAVTVSVHGKQKFTT